jgi:predicted transcriptional regulator
MPPLSGRDEERRSRADIQAAILDCVLTKSASLNRISIFANLNRKAVKDHASRLVSHGLIQVVSGNRGYSVYSASEKGIKWLKRYRNLMDEGGLGRSGQGRDGRDF